MFQVIKTVTDPLHFFKTVQSVELPGGLVCNCTHLIQSIFWQNFCNQPSCPDLFVLVSENTPEILIPLFNSCLAKQRETEKFQLS